MTAAPLTPCIGICVIDPQRQLCTGCHRTLSEIAAWASLSPDQRRAIMDSLPTRATGG